MMFSDLVVIAQRMVYARQWEFRCTSHMWMKLIDAGLPEPILVALANCRPFKIGPVTFRLETPDEVAARQSLPPRSLVPAIVRAWRAPEGE